MKMLTTEEYILQQLIELNIKMDWDCYKLYLSNKKLKELNDRKI